jgi:hypothetical protein
MLAPMASIEMPISEEKLLELLREKYGLEPGKARLVDVEIQALPPVGNSRTSHEVRVTFECGLDLGEAGTLVGF